MGVRMSGFFLAFSIWLKWDTSVSSLFLDQKFQCADMKRRNVEESIVRVTFHRGVSFFVRSSNYTPGWLQRVGENNYLNVWWWHRSVVPATDFKWSQGARVTSFKPVNAALWSLTEDILINHVQDHDALCVKGWGETHLSWKKQGRGCKASMLSTWLSLSHNNVKQLMWRILHSFHFYCVLVGPTLYFFLPNVVPAIGIRAGDVISGLSLK